MKVLKRLMDRPLQPVVLAVVESTGSAAGRRPPLSGAVKRRSDPIRSDPGPDSCRHGLCCWHHTYTTVHTLTPVPKPAVFVKPMQLLPGRLCNAEAAQLPTP